MTIDEQWECWSLCAIKIEGTNRGGRRDDTCDHGLSWISLRVNLLRVELESISDDKKCRYSGVYNLWMYCRYKHVYDEGWGVVRATDNLSLHQVLTRKRGRSKWGPLFDVLLVVPHLAHLSRFQRCRPQPCPCRARVVSRQGVLLYFEVPSIYIFNLSNWSDLNFVFERIDTYQSEWFRRQLSFHMHFRFNYWKSPFFVWLVYIDIILCFFLAPCMCGSTPE